MFGTRVSSSELGKIMEMHDLSRHKLGARKDVVGRTARSFHQYHVGIISFFEPKYLCNYFFCVDLTRMAP